MFVGLSGSVMEKVVGAGGGGVYGVDLSGLVMEMAVDTGGGGTSGGEGVETVKEKGESSGGGSGGASSSCDDDGVVGPNQPNPEEVGRGVEFPFDRGRLSGDSFPGSCTGAGSGGASSGKGGDSDKFLASSLSTT